MWPGWGGGDIVNSWGSHVMTLDLASTPELVCKGFKPSGDMVWSDCGNVCMVSSYWTVPGEATDEETGLSAFVSTCPMPPSLTTAWAMRLPRHEKTAMMAMTIATMPPATPPAMSPTSVLLGAVGQEVDTGTGVE